MGGERGIRTLDSVSGIHAFQACQLNHSCISPGSGAIASQINPEISRHATKPEFTPEFPESGDRKGGPQDFLKLMT